MCLCFALKWEFGETPNPDLASFLFHHDSLKGGTDHVENMRNVTQEFANENQEGFSCAFCDSVTKKIAALKIDPDLESLYLEHLTNYHGLVR